MKIILYSWGGLNEDILENKLNELGFEVIVLAKECEDYTMDASLAASLIGLINEESAEAVVSFNYFPIVSMVCDTCKIPYFSWIYDAPHATLYSKTSSYVINQIGIFDRRFSEFLNGKCSLNTRHVPLAVDTEEFTRRINKESSNKIAVSDVSFVGSLYTDERKVNMYDLYHKQAEDAKEDVEEWKKLDAIVASHVFDYEKDFINEDLSWVNGFLKKYMDRNNMGLGDNFVECYEDVIRESVLEKRVTVLERQALMSAIAQNSADNGYTFNLYTTSDTSKLKALNNCNKGPVDYQNVMPKVFNTSKINLHISLRSIHTGMPLRMLDIMGCGGFLLSNAQEELLEFFDEGHHMVTYRSIDECLDKINYYLKHEDERKKIAQAGFERIRDEFNYEKGLLKLFGIE